MKSRWLLSFLLFSPPILLAVWLAAGTTLAARNGWEGATFEEERFLAAMAAIHGNETPAPTPIARLEPRQQVEGSRVEYADGTTGYLARPKASSGALPGILVIHEWWGLNENVEAMTRRLAGEGYAALAVDLYDGVVATDREGAMTAMRGVTEEQALANIRQGWEYLKQEQDATSVGVIGWSFGGGWSLNTGIALGDDIAATVVYYGRLTTDKDRLARLSSPVLGRFGSEDSSIPVSSVHAFEEAMRQLGKDPIIELYQGADHAFASPSGERYDAEAAQDAWQRTTEFLAEHLD
ncbi:MAG TPA: dienelactone hydrolase family protein [Thermoanaerobaculia bacterium]|nr:dienelactone hydrolase family protein [Thermoanaerobaculia bacterium]